MPTRIIRDGILQSRKVSALSFGAEVFYRRLMSHVDDFGRCEYDPVLMIAYLFPYQSASVKRVDVEGWMAECEVKHSEDDDEDEPLITQYSIGRKTFAQINNFGQRTRSESKCPPPPNSKEVLRASQVQGVVYFINAEKSGKIKIGFTVFTAESRLANLQTGSAEPLELLLALPGTPKLERELHARFAAYRHNGEWFESSEDLLAFILDSGGADKCAQMRAAASRASTPTPTTPPSSTSSPSPTTDARITNTDQQAQQPEAKPVESEPELWRALLFAAGQVGMIYASEELREIRASWGKVPLDERPRAIAGIEIRRDTGEYGDPHYVPGLRRFVTKRLWQAPLRPGPRVQERSPPIDFAEQRRKRASQEFSDIMLEKLGNGQRKIQSG